MTDWERLFSSAGNSAIFDADDTAAAAIGDAARKSGLAFLRLNLALVTGKPAFLKAAAQAFRFPGYFRANWDAFEDCLTDFSWVEETGFVLLIEGAEGFKNRSPADMEMARSIFRDAACYWKSRGIPFFVFLTAEQPSKDDPGGRDR